MLCAGRLEGWNRVWQEPHCNPHSPELPCSGRGVDPGCVDMDLHMVLGSTFESRKEDPNRWQLNSDLRGEQELTRQSGTDEGREGIPA